MHCIWPLGHGRKLLLVTILELPYFTFLFPLYFLCLPHFPQIHLLLFPIPFHSLWLWNNNDFYLVQSIVRTLLAASEYFPLGTWLVSFCQNHQFMLQAFSFCRSLTCCICAFHLNIQYFRNYVSHFFIKYIPVNNPSYYLFSQQVVYLIKLNDGHHRRLGLVK